MKNRESFDTEKIFGRENERLSRRRKTNSKEERERKEIQRGEIIISRRGRER